MIKFLIQAVNGEILHDFAFHLIEAIKYNNWYYNEEKYKYYLGNNILEHDFTDYIPIGSIDFVLNFYKTYHGIDSIKPINVPVALRKQEFLKRSIIFTNDMRDIQTDPNKKVFIKSIDKFKDISDIVKIKEIPMGKNLLVSDVIDILSEWRGFIYNGKLLDIRNYSGDFRLFPNIDIVENMIAGYTGSPKAYTLDVAIDGGKNTVLIEVHQFFSCGLYGFSDYRVLPQMFIASHREIISIM